MNVRSVRLLDHDPELADGLRGVRSDAACAAVTIRVARLPDGRFEPDAVIAAGAARYGLLLIDGLVDRQITLGETTASHLLGPGDVIAAAWDAPYEATLTAAIAWFALGGVDVALLADDFVAAVRPWPEVLAAMMARAGRQAAGVGLRSAILQLPRVEDRVDALLRYLASRWGRVTPDGLLVPIRLTHETIGRLIGARRPTVSLALRQLEAEGVVRRAPHGAAWLLPRERRTDEPPAAVPA